MASETKVSAKLKPQLVNPAHSSPQPRHRANGGAHDSSNEILEAKDGSGPRYRTEIVALQMRLLGNRANGAAAQKAEASDDIPF